MVINFTKCFKSESRLSLLLHNVDKVTTPPPPHDTEADEWGVYKHFDTNDFDGSWTTNLGK